MFLSVRYCNRVSMLAGRQQSKSKGSGAKTALKRGETDGYRAFSGKRLPRTKGRAITSTLTVEVSSLVTL